MKVTVKHYSALLQVDDQRAVEVQMENGDTVKDLLMKLGIKPLDVGILIVSGKQGTFNQPLFEKDQVTIIPHIGGG